MISISPWPSSQRPGTRPGAIHLPPFRRLQLGRGVGCPTFVDEPPGNTLAHSPEAMASTKAYARNLALWLSTLPTIIARRDGDAALALQPDRLVQRHQGDAMILAPAMPPAASTSRHGDGRWRWRRRRVWPGRQHFQFRRHRGRALVVVQENVARRGHHPAARAAAIAWGPARCGNRRRTDAARAAPPSPAPAPAASAVKRLPS